MFLEKNCMNKFLNLYTDNSQLFFIEIKLNNVNKHIAQKVSNESIKKLDFKFLLSFIYKFKITVCFNIGH